ncbi:11737_t:CDS:2, partial [Acaulospora morrowiae]
PSADAGELQTLMRNSTKSEESSAVDGNPPKGVGRIIHVNDPQRNLQQKFLHNQISTAKYNFFTFLPKFLYEQFSKYANLFFLFTGSIGRLFDMVFKKNLLCPYTQIKDVSPTNQFTTLGTLVVVLVATAFKEIVEDYKRHSSDSEVNKRMCKCLEGYSFAQKEWNEVKVGDIV